MREKQGSYETGTKVRCMGGGRWALFGVLLFALLFPSTAVSSPNGVGDEANEGCLCHAPLDQTTVRLDGLPDVYESNTSYLLTLSIENPSVPVGGAYAGGFRILASNGTIEMNASLGQQLGGGWTHTEAGAGQRSWDLVWISPLNNDSRTDFTVHGNAVNGNNAPTEDGWSSLEIAVGGVAFEGPLEPHVGIDGLNGGDKVLLAVGLAVLVGLLWVSARK